ncbi:hypothetical protein EDC01DRAFT_781530 [Geopyxis carbonaria]|nr:hypothetical protein EDC01DRAFT_781530 [Geopyxis carbonaria]
MSTRRQLIDLFAAEAARAEAQIHDLNEQIDTINGRIWDARIVQWFSLMSLQEEPVIPMSSVAIDEALTQDLREQIEAKKNEISDLEKLARRVDTVITNNCAIFAMAPNHKYNTRSTDAAAKLSSKMQELKKTETKLGLLNKQTALVEMRLQKLQEKADKKKREIVELEAKAEELKLAVGDTVHHKYGRKTDNGQNEENDTGPDMMDRLLDEMFASMGYDEASIGRGLC